MTLKYLITLIFIISLQFTFGQNTEILTNKTVTDLVKAGLDNSIILSKIETSKCRFDVSTTALINLQKSGVPKEIIKSMVEKGQIKTSMAVTSVTAVATKTDVPVLTTLSEINSYDHRTKALNSLEKAKASFKQKIPGMGNMTFEIDSVTSPVKFSMQDSISFMVGLTEAQGDPSAWFTLYKLDIRKSKRYTIWIKSIPTGKMNNVIGFTNKRVAAGVFEMVPTAKLDKGEYFFLAKGSMGNHAGRGADVFAFSIQ